MTTLEELDLFDAPDGPRAGAAPAKKCYRHPWANGVCSRCGRIRDDVLTRRARASKNRGGKYELWVARRHGGRKVGQMGGPWDVEGELYVTQVKTHVGLPPAYLTAGHNRTTGFDRAMVRGAGVWWSFRAPARWTGIFAAMASSSRTPRLIEVYLPGQGIQPREFVIYRAIDDPTETDLMVGFVIYAGADHLILYGKDAEVEP